MSYQDNELGLVQMFQELHPVPGTFPPVYMLDDVLIGYDKLEQLRIIAASVMAKSEPVRTRGDWIRFLKKWVDQRKDRPAYSYTNSYHVSSSRCDL
jgi:hypothetical protein